jgi:WD40 repeat protein
MRRIGPTPELRSQEVTMTSRLTHAAIAVTVLIYLGATLWPASDQDYAELLDIGSSRFSHYLAEQNRLLVAVHGKAPELWDTKQGKRVAVLSACKAGIDTEDVSPDGSQFATGDTVGYPYLRSGKRCVRSLRIWETATGKQLRTIKIDLSGDGARDTTDWSVSWLDGRTLLLELYCRQNPARFSVGTIFMRVDVERGKVLEMSDRLPISEGLTLSPDGKRAVAGGGATWRNQSGAICRGGQNTVELVDMNAFAVVAKLEASQQPNALFVQTWSPDSRWLAAAAADNAVRVWDGRDGGLVATLTGHTHTVASIRFSPDGRTLLTASDDDTARVWDVTTGNLVHTLAGHTAGLTTAAFDAIGTRVLTGGEDQTARLWDAATGKQLRVWPDHESGVRNVAFAADGKEVRTRTARDIERVWSVDDGKLVSEKQLEYHLGDRYGVCVLRSKGEDTEVWVEPAGAILPLLPDDG